MDGILLIFFLKVVYLQIPSRLHICTIMSVWVQSAEHFPSDFFVCQVLSPHHIEQVSWIALWMCFSKCLCLCLCTGHVMSYHHSNVKSPEFSQIFKIINKKSKLSKIAKKNSKKSILSKCSNKSKLSKFTKNLVRPCVLITLTIQVKVLWVSGRGPFPNKIFSFAENDWKT